MAINVKLKPEDPEDWEMLDPSCQIDREYDPEELGFYPSGKPIARGYDELREYFKKIGQPLFEDQNPPEDQKVNISIRIPRSYALGLRSTGRGWRTRVGEYLINGIKRGDLGKF